MVTWGRGGEGYPGNWDSQNKSILENQAKFAVPVGENCQTVRPSHVWVNEIHE